MTTPPGEFAPLRFSTDDLPERDRLTVWREVCGRMIMRVDMEPAPDRPFHCAARIRALPGLVASSITTSPNRLTRSRELVADGNDDLVLTISLAGTATMSQRGREVALGRGDAVLLSQADPLVTEVRSTAHFVSLVVPAATLKQLIGDPDAALVRPIPRDTATLRLLTTYAQALDAEPELAAPELRRAAVTHLHDLTALALGATRDAAEIARGRGLRVARLRAVKADIVENLLRRDLSLESVAARHGISPRYVGKLFAGVGTTFTDFVLAERLARAHRMLVDARFADRSISAIAFDAGFGDLSYFNHAFRRRYGATPSDVRAASRGAR